MAFLFTVLGEWLVEGKVISRGTAPRLLSARGKFCRKPGSPFAGNSGSILTSDADTGAGMLLSLVGIALCVFSKT
ncbi:hypothetical protein IF1G_08181 [Cordyceps javanica]|uniref:Uncharacterized protein n=1 Tax=Cordyceps javanica TaxID=43265 RepID=A0A545UTT2_9HYPO|nr:hypothetical protein IF1G_08181 [Cordyceps javanica]